MLWLLGLLLFSLYTYYYLYKPQTYWRRKNVKQGPAVPLLGDSAGTFLKIDTFYDMFNRIYTRYKNVRYVGMYQATLPTLMLRDPELIKQITVKDFDHFVDHRQFISESCDPLWCKNLVALKGDVWRDMRATLSPSFTASKMRAMFNLMDNSAQQFVNFYWNKNEDLIEVQLKDSFTRFANDVIANCAFGIQVDSLKDPTNEFYLHGKDATDFGNFWTMLKMMTLGLFPKLAQILGLGMFSKKTAKFFVNLVKNNVKHREEQNISRPDMINLLMEARKGRLKYEESNEVKDAGFATVEESEIGRKEVIVKKEMTDLDMAAQVMIFFLAGFDTIATMMSFLGYELAVNPDIQEKLRQEVDEAYDQNNGKLSYDLLNKMKYMDMVISENMRKNPPSMFTDRICTKPYTIQPERPDESPVDLKVGDYIILPVMCIHHDEKYYPDPEKFDPERFSDEIKNSIRPYTYLPFGSGPRNCIGSRFALMEAKTLMFHILRKFEFIVIKKTPIPLKLSTSQFTPFIEGGFWVGLKRREIN